MLKLITFTEKKIETQAYNYTMVTKAFQKRTFHGQRKTKTPLGQNCLQLIKLNSSICIAAKQN